MIRRTFNYLWHRIAGLRKDSEGFVVMSTLAIFLFIFVLCAFVYAVGETIHQKIKIQNACDAAAYSAAVVQADGLSRMAAVNRAMAWSYVQMTNRQMDYITYRWLKLTCKRFGEDLANAEEYNDNIVLAVDKELGWWALLELVISGAISKILGLDCSGQLGGEIEGVWHGEEGHGWWCGLEVGDRKGHNIRLNHPKNEGFLNSLATSGIEAVTDKFTTYENINRFLNVLKFLDKGSGPSGWGELLGKWIDYDKSNIENMNKALERINSQMTVAMKMTAESTLKSMLADPRGGGLDDFFISIHIPEGKNPYDDEAAKGDAPKSFFSPLHNTEAEEMLFLNMPSADSASKTLLQHFPALLNDSSAAFGLDQWFIRGKALYSDGKDHSYDPSPLKKVSFKHSAKDHTATMVRDEGMQGIQRVYKDANLNENNAGFLSSGNGGSSKDAVWRGNHLLDFMNLTNNVTNAIKGYLSGSFGGGGGGGSGSGISNEADLRDRMDEIRQDAIDNGQQVSDGDPLATKGGQTVDFSSQKESSGFMQQGIDLLGNAVSNVVGNMIGNFIDVHPSCENDPDLDYAKYPMCEQIKDPTSALYSEYRWGSGKWFCATKAFAYLVCMVFDYPKIYCDLPSADLEISFLGIEIDISVEGYAHIGLPKWFCGHDPSGFDVLPPLIPSTISGGKHGYMDNNITDLFDGFVRPMQALWGDEKERTFSRDEYESCAMFFDGIGDCVTVLGHYTYPGLIRGHARIYGDDKDIFDNRYVGARCKPWVLNERYFAGDGTIVVGAAMKHTNPLVRLFNFWNMKGGKLGTETQKDAEHTVLSAFNIPEGNFMVAMSAARAGVRHTRRNGEFDQERQYQITYDSTCDPENLTYANGPYVLMQEKGNKDDKGRWVSVDAWGGDHGDNPNAISRAFEPNGKSQEQTAIWNGCPCSGNERQFHDMWNLCETDWDATLLPLRCAAQKATFHMGNQTKDDRSFNQQNYKERVNLLNSNYKNAQSDSIVGNGKSWTWGALDAKAMAKSPFITGGWKKGDSTFFEDAVSDIVPGILGTGMAAGSGLNLNTKVPVGKEEESVNVMTILKDKTL